jgi:hypothetical protein
MAVCLIKQRLAIGAMERQASLSFFGTLKLVGVLHKSLAAFVVR